MLSLGEFLLRRLPRRVFERGGGLLVFLGAAFFFLHEELFSQIIVTIAIAEFYFGFLTPILRSVGVVGSASQVDRVLFFGIILLPSITGLIVFDNHIASSVFALTVVVLTPWILEAKISLEKTDVDAAIKVETQGAMIGALAGSFVLMICYCAPVLSDVGSPVVRPALAIIAQGFLLGWPPVSISRKSGFSDISVGSLLKSLRGVDFGALVLALRITLLKALAVSPEGSLMVKGAVLLYEPMASTLGLLLRFLNAQALFLGRGYAALSLVFFAGQSAVLILTLLATLYFGGSELLAFWVMLLLLFAASLTTHFIYASTVTKGQVIFILTACLAACSILEIYEATTLTSLLLIVIFFLMHTDLITKTEGRAG